MGRAGRSNRGEWGGNVISSHDGWLPGLPDDDQSSRNVTSIYAYIATSLISLEKLWNVLIMMIMLNQESNDSNRLAILINNADDNSGRINLFGRGL